jgi:hypothetical protein
MTRPPHGWLAGGITQSTPRGQGNEQHSGPPLRHEGVQQLGNGQARIELGQAVLVAETAQDEPRCLPEVAVSGARTAARWFAATGRRSTSRTGCGCSRPCPGVRRTSRSSATNQNSSRYPSRRRARLNRSASNDPRGGPREAARVPQRGRLRGRGNLPRDPWTALPVPPGWGSSQAPSPRSAPTCRSTWRWWTCSSQAARSPSKGSSMGTGPASCTRSPAAPAAMRAPGGQLSFTSPSPGVLDMTLTRLPGDPR